MFSSGNRSLFASNFHFYNLSAVVKVVTNDMCMGDEAFVVPFKSAPQLQV